MLVLQEVPPDDLASLLEFLYLGRVSVSQARLPSFLRAAAALRVHGLAETQQPPSRPKKRKSSVKADKQSSGTHENGSPNPVEFLSVKQEEEEELEQQVQEEDGSNSIAGIM